MTKVIGHQVSFPTKNGGTLYYRKFVRDYVRMVQKRKKLVLIRLYLRYCIAKVLFTYRYEWLYIFSFIIVIYQLTSYNTGYSEADGVYRALR